MTTIHLVLGGIRSGKSAWAETLAARMAADGCRPVIYLATGIATDAEMADRIRRHRQRRPSEWQTIEAPLNPVAALPNYPPDTPAVALPDHPSDAPLPDTPAVALPDHPLDAPLDDTPAVALLDSLDGWASNLLLEHETAPPAELEARVAGAARRFIAAIRERGWDAVIVSSEVGMSPVAATHLGRRFQDLLGTVNQAAAAAADRVTLVTAGIPVPIKPDTGQSCANNSSAGNSDER